MEPGHSIGEPNKKDSRAKLLLSESLHNWGGWTRTINFLINSQAVCQLTYAPSLVPCKQNGPPLYLAGRVTC